MAKRTLGEKLGDLDVPDDYDIENNEFHEFGSESGSVLESEDDQEAREHYVPVSRSKLRSLAGSLNGKYKGSVVSRKQMEESEEEEEDEEDEDDDLVDEDEDTNAESEEHDEDDDSQEDSDEEEDLIDGDSYDKKQDMPALLAAERKQVIQRLSQSSTADALKGYSIHRQQKLFDSIIEARMKVQKSLTNSNLLPAKKIPEHKCSSKNYKKAEEACYDLLDSIFKLRQQLMKQEQVSDDKVKLPKKRKLDQYIDTTGKYDAMLNKYRASVLTKWSNKIQNSSGSRALNDSKFKAINQLAEQQVQNHLLDKERLVKRTRLNRNNVRPLGYESESENEADEDTDVPQPRARGEIAQIFDDSDFYRVLLNDLVDKKVQTTNPTTGLNVALALRASKLKNLVDTKASKGRKLRYHVQEPIANFDAPRGNWVWNEDQIDEFFASLLGQKVNMNEEENEDDTEELVPQDSILIFS